MIHASTSDSAVSSAATLAAEQQLLSVHGAPGLWASITSIRSGKRSSNCFQVASVSANRTPVSIVNARTEGSISDSMWNRTDSSFWKEQASFNRG